MVCAMQVLCVPDALSVSIMVPVPHSVPHELSFALSPSTMG